MVSLKLYPSRFNNIMHIFILRNGKVYARAFKKTMEDGEYPQKEAARLNQMVDSGKVNSKKADEFQKRINIVNSFVADDE